MKTLLEMSGVSVSFDGFKAINNLSFRIGEPELRAIIGPNGAGKTTMMDTIWLKRNCRDGTQLCNRPTRCASSHRSIESCCTVSSDRKKQKHSE